MKSYKKSDQTVIYEVPNRKSKGVIKSKQEEQRDTQNQDDTDLSMIKSFVQFCTNRQQKRKYTQNQINRLKEEIPRLKEIIAEHSLLKTQCQTKLVTMEVTVMNQLQNIRNQSSEIDKQTTSLIKKIQQNNSKIQRFRENKKCIEKLTFEFENIRQAQKNQLTGINQRISILKKQKLLKKAQQMNKKQVIEHLYIKSEQQRNLQQVKKNRDQFKAYYDQIISIKNGNIKQRQDTLISAREFIKQKANMQLNSFNQKINQDMQILKNKMQQTRNVEDFRALLKFAGIPTLQYSLTQEEQTFLNFYIEYYPLEGLQYLKFEEMALKNQSLQELSILQSNINSKDKQVSTALAQKNEQVNLMQSKYSQIIMELMKLTDRSSRSLK